MRGSVPAGRYDGVNDAGLFVCLHVVMARQPDAGPDHAGQLLRPLELAVQHVQPRQRRGVAGVVGQVGLVVFRRPRESPTERKAALA